MNTKLEEDAFTADGTPIRKGETGLRKFSRIEEGNLTTDEHGSEANKLPSAISATLLPLRALVKRLFSIADEHRIWRKMLKP
ncbi:MAG TPA: hypothetical protein VEH04_09655 [Verrucomicrobiae bacterium]|nr:hypothetical protein [Verrucomicrobiae bacterium]